MPRTISNGNLLMQHEPSSAVSELYRNLRFNMHYALAAHGSAVVAVTSALEKEGKTTTLANVAVAAAEAGQKVLAVDANLRKPALHAVFGLPNGTGLSEYLSRGGEGEPYMRETAYANLHVMLAGSIPANPPELLASAGMRAGLEGWKRQYDLVLVDTPPMLHLIDAKLLVADSDGVLLVVEHGRLKRAVAKKLQEDFAHMEAALLGVVYNKINHKEARSYWS